MGSRSPTGRGNFKGEKGLPLYSMGLFPISCAETAEPIANRYAVWNAESGEPKEPRIRWGTDLPLEQAILRRGRACPNMPDDTLM